MHSKRINEIDLLRFIAAVAVVLFHYAFRGYYSDNMTSMHYPAIEGAAKYGYLGVELFFMISGFVILMSVSGESVREFFVSRVTRLYPAFWVCCTLTFLATLLIGGERYEATLPQYLKNMTMLGGFVGVSPIDGSYWSLFVEIRFYAIIAALLLIRQMRRVEMFLALWILATVAIEIANIKILKQLLITGYSGYFIAGAFFFKVWESGLSAKRLTAIAACFFITTYQSILTAETMSEALNTDFSLAVVCIVNASIYALIYLISVGKTGPIKHMTWKTIGALTYPLYLIHQFLGFMIFNAFSGVLNEHAVFWSTIALMISISYCVNVIERKSAKPMKTWLFSVLRIGRAQPRLLP